MTSFPSASRFFFACFSRFPCLRDHPVGLRAVYNRSHLLLEEEEEEPLLIYTAQGSPFRRKKLSVINGSPEQQRTKTTLNI